MRGPLQSWGRYPRAKQQREHPITWVTEGLPDPAGGTLLPYGQGRSYGDSCLNEGGTLLTTGRLDRFLAFDPSTGVLRCEAGVTLDAILELVTPQGWFLPVTPGTRFVSVGGAIANDVHGKNHHRAGTFGRHVRCFELLRSDGQRRLCSPTENPEWYAATIGGLGLTGFIVWAEIQLRRIANPYILTETVPFQNLEEFFEVSRASDADYEFTVGWVDCLARGRRLGRGVFFRGNHAPPQLEARSLIPSRVSRGRALALPFELPSFTVNPLTVRAFNFLYDRVQRSQPPVKLTHYEPFFYPLDGVRSWNRIYGRRGFLQFQCVVPFDHGDGPIRRILEEITRSRLGSFLTVLKTFGSLPSPGLMSFPRPGVTLAIDFNNGERTYRLFDVLDRLTREHGGAVYPAKDARMAPESFAAYFPQRERFAQFIDPAFSSSFWRRVNGAPRTGAP